jgi:hypothetical protein
MAKHNVSLYRALHHLRHGGLHKALGVKEGDTIPVNKIHEAAKKGGHLGHMANFALTMRGFKKK